MRLAETQSRIGSHAISKRSKQRKSEAKTRRSLCETRGSSLLKTEGECGNGGRGAGNAGLNLWWREKCGTARQHTFSPGFHTFPPFCVLESLQSLPKLRRRPHEPATNTDRRMGSIARPHASRNTLYARPARCLARRPAGEQTTPEAARGEPTSCIPMVCPTDGIGNGALPPENRCSAAGHHSVHHHPCLNQCSGPSQVSGTPEDRRLAQP